MPAVLMVPVHIDALVLKHELSVLEPMADFSRLPYFNGERQVNPDIANISEEILSQPFDDRGLFLRPGVHLHWAMPDALTQGRSVPKGEPASGREIKFLPLPNRWLITRKDRSGGEMKWVVESDYLHPPDPERHPGAVTYPYPYE